MMKLPRSLPISISISILALLSGCASFRSNLQNGFDGQARRNESGKQVSVLFTFSHIKQSIGYDAIPKLEGKREALSDFDDIFSDALRELSNVKTYATFTDEATDVNNPDRRHQKDSLTTANDYSMRVRIETTTSFARDFLGGCISTVTATLAPFPYRWDYKMITDVYDHERKLVKTYERRASMTKWVEALLIVAYPFYPEERKREEIYMMFLHDTFKQIESEGVLR